MADDLAKRLREETALCRASDPRELGSSDGSLEEEAADALAALAEREAK